MDNERDYSMGQKIDINGESLGIIYSKYCAIGSLIRSLKNGDSYTTAMSKWDKKRRKKYSMIIVIQQKVETSGDVNGDSKVEV